QRHSRRRMSRVRTYAQLVRLPNVFTAVADIALGALAAGALPTRWLAFLVLALTSACLYSAGMGWYYYFDVEQDKKERPFRPLPSGRISPREAVRFGTALFASGLLLALCTGWILSQWREPEEGRNLIWTPFVLPSLLIAAILVYDGWL